MRIVNRARTRLSPWVTLVERAVELNPNGNVEIFHSLDQADYVTVLAVTGHRRVPLVRQFRPAQERVTLELPGGLMEGGSSPEETAKNELFEETGYRPKLPMAPLGCLAPDTGRLENRFWGFFASPVVPDDSWRQEEGIEPVLLSKSEIESAIANGDFTHALHIALLGLAVMKGLF